MCCFLHRKISPFYSTNPICYFQDFFFGVQEFETSKRNKLTFLYYFFYFNRQLLSYSLVSTQLYCYYPQYWDSQASANSVDPDQMAPSGAVRSGSTLFVI